LISSSQLHLLRSLCSPVPPCQAKAQASPPSPQGRTRHRHLPPSSPLTAEGRGIPPPPPPSLCFPLSGLTRSILISSSMVLSRSCCRSSRMRLGHHRRSGRRGSTHAQTAAA
jgi:hypothetical protein